MKTNKTINETETLDEAIKRLDVPKKDLQINYQRGDHFVVDALKEYRQKNLVEGVAIPVVAAFYEGMWALANHMSPPEGTVEKIIDYSSLGFFTVVAGVMMTAMALDLADLFKKGSKAESVREYFGRRSPL